MVELSSLTSVTPAWVSRVYWCILLVYCSGFVAISACAQSSKIQTNSLCLAAPGNHLFPDLLRAVCVTSLQYTLFRTVAKGRWSLPQHRFSPLSLHYVYVPREANWSAVHSRCNSACGLCSHPVRISPACLVSAREVHSTYEPTVPNVCLWSGKGLSEGEEFPATYSAKGFK